MDEGDRNLELSASQRFLEQEHLNRMKDTYLLLYFILLSMLYFLIEYPVLRNKVPDVLVHSSAAALAPAASSAAERNEGLADRSGGGGGGRATQGRAFPSSTAFGEKGLWFC